MLSFHLSIIFCSEHVFHWAKRQFSNFLSFDWLKKVSFRETFLKTVSFTQKQSLRPNFNRWGTELTFLKIKMLIFQSFNFRSGLYGSIWIGRNSVHHYKTKLLQLRCDAKGERKPYLKNELLFTKCTVWTTLGWDAHGNLLDLEKKLFQQ